MKRLLPTFGLILAAGCASTPYTKRHQLVLVSHAQEMKMGEEAYADVLAKAKLSQDKQAVAMIERVGKRLAAVAERPDFDWKFSLIDEPKTVNAFCLPGGRVAFYTGILPVTKDETGVATVMSHEVAHALARHGVERMSQQMAGGTALNILLAGKGPAAQELTAKAFGLGIVLPFSRHHESEADHIGLILMAKAGYDPRAAVEFWRRMQANAQGKAPPELLSTHPSDSTRIKKIEDELPEALTYYKPAQPDNRP